MISNHPSMIGHQEFQAQHSDMLAAARRGDVVDPISVPEIEDIVHGIFAKWFAEGEERSVTIGSQLRIRMPKLPNGQGWLKR